MARLPQHYCQVGQCVLPFRYDKTFYHKRWKRKVEQYYCVMCSRIIRL